MSLHLSYPGQHLHAVFLQISSSIPAFRKVIDSSHWSLAPAEFSHNPAFVEGWALYSEYIGEEIGLYDTPLKRLVKVARELATASSLVVDTGIHALGWTIEDAQKFLLENTALSKEMIESNLQRVITWPGQTCSAKVGEIKLKELRQRAENALGTSFHLEEFHNVLLQCTSSLNVVQKCVTHYISEKIRLHEQHHNNDQGLNEGDDYETKKEEGVSDQDLESGSNAISSTGCSVHIIVSRCIISYHYLYFIFILIYYTGLPFVV
ncbi:UNVERIFIED_CONTAM: hypothetical protein GTU68_010512 [Idotea baltica]|nr:hypothetical protein [Idotea baltica]